MELAKLTSQGQITIPSDIRKYLNLKSGDKDFLECGVTSPRMMTLNEFELEFQR